MNIFKKIKYWLSNKYILSDEERKIWDNIKIKANIGYKEWLNKTHGDDICGPWIKDIQVEEIELIERIHDKFYGKDWYIAVPISTSQCCYVEYEYIKNKVI